MRVSFLLIFIIAIAVFIGDAVAKWQEEIHISPIDDSTNATIFSSSPIKNQYGRDASARISFNCREGNTSFFIYFGGHFMSDYRHGRVIFRVDKKPAFERKLFESNNNEALGY